MGAGKENAGIYPSMLTRLGAAAIYLRAPRAAFEFSATLPAKSEPNHMGFSLFGTSDLGFSTKASLLVMGCRVHNNHNRAPSAVTRPQSSADPLSTKGKEPAQRGLGEPRAARERQKTEKSQASKPKAALLFFEVKRASPPPALIGGLCFRFS